ncbi:hypothetical protein ALI22I_14065 [Saccharothrix sp. ALI-22-I]|uniref:hypothetical protein n=1 Tax=Saccharothrix sp. ALI-22-I TaxID=1933778 RepID=UPI00097C1306|nr:hypothetical protein [Saccharothrix sp. ALI-22-I]ONI90028.1 hypothetical protein ALI22I_14065 [Saccharothrix sp. ALI-22-I]
MRIVVWVLERPDVVRDLLLDRAARPRRLVPTPYGTLLLGPAPEDLRVLRAGMKAATTGDRPAIGFAWSDDTARLLVRAAGRVQEAEVGGTMPDDVVRALASVLGVDDVRAALARAQGRGLDRLRHFLELIGYGAEARLLDWVDRTGPEIVPVHRERWWERVIGEQRQPRNTGLQPFRRTGGVVAQVLWLLLGVVALVAFLPFANEVFPAWMVVGYVVGVVPTAVGSVAAGALMIARWRRPDPFPISDPLGVMADAPDFDGTPAGG